MYRGLWGHWGVQGSHVRRAQARNASIHGAGTALGGPLSAYDGRRPFRSERCLFSRHVFLRGAYLCYKLSCYLIQPPRYDQVLTGIVPFEDSYVGSVVADIRLGKRPPRPTDPTRNEWLHNHVWDVITTCWSDKPEQRSGLSALHHTFLTLSPQIAKSAKSARSERKGNLTVQNGRNITVAKQFRMMKQRHSDAGQSFRGSRLSYRLCGVQTQGSRNLWTTWIR